MIFLFLYINLIGVEQRFTCDITTNPITPNIVINKLFESFPGKMLWKMDGEALENTNEYEKVNIFYLYLSIH